MQKIDNIDLSLLIFSEFLTWRHQNVSVPVTMQTVVVATWFKNSTMFTRKKELPQAKDRKVTVGQISLADWSDRTKVHVWKLSVFFRSQDQPDSFYDRCANTNFSLLF